MAVAPVLLARAPGAQYVLADKGYDADTLRRGVRQSGAVPVIPGRSTRKRRIVYDKSRYRERHLIENAFCRLKDFRSVATRYDKLARNFLSAVALAAILAFWIRSSLDPKASPMHHRFENLEVDNMQLRFYQFPHWGAK